MYVKMSELNKRERLNLGTMNLACCALFPECTAKEECKELLQKLGVSEYDGSIMLSRNTFDKAKRHFLENLK